MTQSTGFQGLDYLIELIQAQLDPSQPKPPQPGRKPADRNGQAKTIAELQGQMANALEEQIQKNFGPYSGNGIFILNAGQQNTLERLDLHPQTVRQIRSLNWLSARSIGMPVSERLKTIAALPATAKGSQTDWKQWWLERWEDRIGVWRPQDHDPQQDPVSDILNQAIRAMAQAAAPEMPSHGEVAQHLLENPPGKDRSRRKTPLPLNLSAVWIAIQDMGKLAQRIGLTPEEQPLKMPESPEALLTELREAGFRPRQDLGTIGGIAELREILQQGGIAEIWTDGLTGQWHDQNIGQSYKLCQNRIHRISVRDGVVRHGENGAALSAGRTEQPEITDAELWLIHDAELEQPGLDDRPLFSPDPDAANIGFLNQVPPQAVRDYLEGRSEDPSPAPPPPCPRAAQCVSWCGRLQQSGEYPFPLTHDGKFESCNYWRFLERYGHLPPEHRASVAEAVLTKERKERQQRRAKEYSPEKPELKHRSGNTATEEEERTETSEGRTQEKNQQAALF